MTTSHWDRAAHRRRDQAWLARALGEATLLVVWRSKNLFIDASPPRPLELRAADQPELLEEGATPIFLGLRDDRPVFAVDLSAHDDPGVFGLPGRFDDLRRAGLALAPADFAPLAYARGMCRWNRRTRFCERCGGPLATEEAGFAKRCEACQEGVYPRTDPAVMILVTRGDRCLLARQPRFPAGMFSTLAGFVEVGESLEECVRRETLEEVGLAVDGLRYVASQPWPFPQSLMLGFRAESADDALRLDDDELEAARWFSRGELRRPRGFFYPPPMSLAHRLIRQFVDEG